MVKSTRGLPKIARQRSPLHGYGVFAAETITKNRRVIDYAGELIRNGKVSDEREERYLRSGCIWVFRINRAWSRDAAAGGNVHNVDFSDAQPSACTQAAGANSGPVPPLPAVPGGQGWTGTCRFDVPGTYTFTCDAHAFETGTIVVLPK